MFTCYHVANSADRVDLLVGEGEKHILVSYAYLRRGDKFVEKIKGAVKRGVRFMIDSGAHSNTAHPGTVVLKEYLEWLRTNASIADEYIVLDNPVKRADTIKNLAIMMQEGLKPITVDHIWFKFAPEIIPWYRKGGRLCWAGMLVGEGTPMGDWARTEKKMPEGYSRTFQSRKQWEAVAKRLVERHGHAKKPPVSDIHLLGVGARLRRFLPFFDMIKTFDSASVFIAAGYGRVCLSRPPKEEGLPPRCSGFPVGRGRKAPDEVRALLSKWKLNPDNEVDRRKFNIRELRKYYQALWDYHQKEHGKGHDHLLEMAVRKSEDDDLPMPAFMIQVPAAIAASYGDRIRLEQMEEVKELARMQVSDVCPSRLARLPDPSLVLLHDEAHGLQSEDPTGLSQAHLFMVQEMSKRRLGHLPEPDGLDFSSRLLGEGLGLSADELGTLGLIEKQMVMQTLILSKDRFKTVADAKKWIKDHGFHIGPKSASESQEVLKPDVDETETSFRFRQRPPTDFVPGSMRTITITDGVQAVVGELKPGVEKVADGDEALFQPVMDARLLPVDKADEDRQVVLGVVLEPDSVDTQGDTISPEEIEGAAHRWLARFQDRGFMHRQIVNSKIEIYESYLSPTDLTLGGQKVKKGSWLLMYHVTDDALWGAIKRGDLTGFSMGGFARRVKT